MPRLSLWREHKTNDYRFLDRVIREQYVVGGIDIYIHKYLGPIIPDEPTGDATLPTYSETDPLFIEDLLLLENRNRKYAEDVFTLRGVYRVQDIDFDLTQFGLFLQNDTLFITFHYNDMIDHFGRKIMNGDVLEIPNLKDYHPLNPNIPRGLPKFYVVNDANFASEGFSSTWYPHLWRVKAVPLVGSQEYKDILDNFIDTEGGIDGDDGMGNGSGTLADYMATCAKNLDINQALIYQAEVDVPYSGYDVSKFYIVGADLEGRAVTADQSNPTADSNDPMVLADTSYISPPSNGYAVGYLTGDALPPNGADVSVGVAFPPGATEGTYVLRVDYMPNRLFRYDGNIWQYIEDNVRTELTPGPDNKTQRSKFVNNTDALQTSDRGTIPSRQSLSDLLNPEADN